MIQYINCLLTLGLLVTLGACNKIEDAAPKKTTPTTTISNSQIVAGNNEFALSLYQQLVDEDKNQLLSPYSISTAMAMVYAGTDGNTATEMQNILGFGANNSSFHQAFNQIGAALETNISSPVNSEFNVVNKIWRNQSLTFLPDFEATMNNDYWAPVAVGNFGQPSVAKQVINDWVKQETHQLIPDLLPDGFIQPQTAAVLVNALYFKADWFDQFPTHNTTTQPFTRSDFSTVPVDMMSNLVPTEDVKFTEDADVEVLELFFKDKQSSMVLLLPKNTSQGINDFVQQTMTSAKLDQWIADLAYLAPNSNISVNLPKWSFKSDFDLVETLKVMGIHDAFTAGVADFSNMANAGLSIDQIKHKAVIDTHEGGVEAAAATAVGIVFTSIPPVAKRILADRPFVFLIKDTETNSILFIGHVQDPNA